MNMDRREFLRKFGSFSAAAAAAAFLPLNTAGKLFAYGGSGESLDSFSDEVLAAVYPGFEPAYLKLHRSGELKHRAQELHNIMEKCSLCPRECGANRLKGETGFCRSRGTRLVVASFHTHFGEEKGLVGRGGSGTIFFSNCSLQCVFCQNWNISHLGSGAETGIKELAEMMLSLQRRGAHNINLVTPTHYSAHILEAIDAAAARGLRLPVVYNTAGWEKTGILRYFDGVVDIYLPDFKYFDTVMAEKYSAGAGSYPELTKKAIIEMNRQTGTAIPHNDGIIYRGLMIRHLVMPEDVGGSKKIMEWAAHNLPKETYINIMAQYSPSYKAYDYPELSRRVTDDEYKSVVIRAQELGLTNLDIQGFWWLR